VGEVVARGDKVFEDGCGSSSRHWWWQWRWWIRVLRNLISIRRFECVWEVLKEEQRLQFCI